MVGRRKLPDPSLNCIFNALSIGVQSTLSFQLTNFGLKCILQENIFRLRKSWLTSRRIDQAQCATFFLHRSSHGAFIWLQVSIKLVA